MKRIISLALAIMLFATSFAYAEQVKTEEKKEEVKAEETKKDEKAENKKEEVKAEDKKEEVKAEDKKEEKTEATEEKAEDKKEEAKEEVKAEEPKKEEVKKEAVKAEAEVTFQEVYLDGVKIELGAYLINQRNYVKLRDVAAILAATDAKYNVDFDKEKKQVVIKTGEAYEKQEKDLTPLAKGKQVAVISEQNFMFNGEEKAVETALINQNNYLQLRQLGELVGFGVNYNKETKAIELTSKKAEATEEKAEDKKAEAKEEKKEEAKEEVVEPFVNLSEKKELKAEEQEKLVKAITEKIAENKEAGAVKNITLTKVTEEKKDDKVVVTYEGTAKAEHKDFTFAVVEEADKVEVKLEEVAALEKKMEEMKDKAAEMKDKAEDKAKEVVENLKDAAKKAGEKAKEVLNKVTK